MKQIAIIALLLASFAFAQDDQDTTDNSSSDNSSRSSSSRASGNLAFGKGTKALGLGVNLYTGYVGYDYNYGGIYSGYNYGAAFGVTVSFDVGAINDMISFGGDVTWYTKSYDWNWYGYNGNKLRNNGFAILFRGGFHPFGIPALQGKIKVANKMDPYVVIKMGPEFLIQDDYYKENPAYPNYDRVSGHFNFLVAAGIRYYFTDSFGVWGEFDWDNIIGGVSFKF